MYPLILLSKQPEAVEDYLVTFKQKQGFLSAYTFEIRPLKTEITIDQIRELKKNIITATKQKRLILLYSFDNANLESQNALLKTLEEKNDSNQFVMVVKNVERVLPTIRSRSQIISLLSQESATVVQESTKELVEAILNKNTYHFMAHPSIQSITREDALQLLEEVLMYLKETYLVEKKQTAPLLKKLLEQLQLLQNNNLNPQLAIDHALLLIQKAYRS